MPFLFALTLGLGAVLLFSVQPMIAKMVLPLLGGSPAVWTTCTLFFQAALLAGYAYAHAGTARLGGRRQLALHALVLALPLAFLPIGIAEDAARTLPSGSGPGPTVWLLGLLSTAIGLPFFAVSTTAPLLQRWFSRTGHPSAADPYFLYASSNLGSMLALLGYPLAIEPNLPLARQATLWAWGYRLLAVLILACAVAAWRQRAVAEPSLDALPRLANRSWLRWAALAFIPSSLMLGVTTYLSTDIAPVPLLWVVPLALYLLSFILVFSRRPAVPHRWMTRAFPFAFMGLAFVLGLGLVQPFFIPLHLLTFFLAAMVCHGELARGRPEVRHLTAYYLAIAAGGALGGAFNALVAPALFDRIAEYPLALVLACLALPGRATGPRTSASRVGDGVLPAAIFLATAALVMDFGGWSESTVGMLVATLTSGLVVLVCWTHRTRPARFALGIGAVLLASGLSAGLNGRVLLQERNFFGVLQVTYDARTRSHRFFHGRTLHGQQSLDPALRREPQTYFWRNGPIGQVFEALDARPGRPGVAIVGLGVGTLAAYARPGERWTFYEIDPAIARVARDPRLFTYLDDSRAGAIDVVLGDARLRLREAPDRAYGLIVLDAFSADAVPIHLLTREALALYRAKLAPGGILAFQITNRYVDLDPVLGALARDAGFACRLRYDLELRREEARAGKQRSIWAVLAASEADLGALATDPRWRSPRLDGGQAWRDDYSNLAGHLLLRPR